MALRHVGPLPEEALAASAEFHARVLPGILDLLAELDSPGPGEDLTLVFPPADYTHRGWRLAAVQQLARRHAPTRVNAVAGADAAATAAAARYLASAEGVTGQYLLLDGTGAGELLYSNE